MDLSIIIVSWNTRDLLKKCLASIFAHTRNIKFEIIVVDNNSQDGSQLMIEKDFPQVKLIRNKKNTGFAYANNQAIKESQGRYILLLNPDTELIDNSLEKIIRLNDGHNDWGVIGCKILNPDGSLQKSVRRFPQLKDQILIQLKLHHLPFFNKFLSAYLAKDFDYQKQASVDQVMGAFFLTKRELLNRLGLFDERFYLWFEEVDFCQRIKNAGFEVVYTPEINIVHHGAQSFKQLDWRKQLVWNHSVQHYFFKHKPKWQWLSLWLLQPISLLLAIIINHWKK